MASTRKANPSQGDSKRHVIASTVTVYRGGHRRYFSKKAAYLAAARALIDAKYPCECDGGDYITPPDVCERHAQPMERQNKLVRRLARFLAFVDGRVSGELPAAKAPRLTPYQRDMLRDLLLGPITPRRKDEARARSLVSRGFAGWDGGRLCITVAGLVAAAAAHGGGK